VPSPHSVQPHRAAHQTNAVQSLSSCAGVAGGRGFIVYACASTPATGQCILSISSECCCRPAKREARRSREKPKREARRARRATRGHGRREEGRRQAGTLSRGDAATAQSSPRAASHARRDLRWRAELSSCRCIRRRSPAAGFHRKMRDASAAAAGRPRALLRAPSSSPAWQPQPRPRLVVVVVSRAKRTNAR